MKIILLSLMMIITATDSTFSQENKAKAFAIYLLPNSIKSSQLAKLDLKKLKPVGKPFIYQHDIQTYNQDKHEFQIASFQVGEKLQKQKNELRGRTFAVFVGDEAIYVGAFGTSIWSQSFDGIYIDIYVINKENPILKFALGYPTEKFFKGNDLRSDLRILKAFEQVGNLYDDFEIIGKCKSIIGTGKRHQSYIFNFEIVSITKGKFDQNEVEFELFSDFGGGKMLRDLETEKFLPYSNEDLNFDKNKEFILKFEKRVGRPDAKYQWLRENEYHLKDWFVKK